MFKFTDATGATYYQGREFRYNLPRADQKWSDPTMHPDPAAPDGKACGAGRLHAMLHLDASYAPSDWRPWWCRGVGQETGRDREKASYPGLQLRRISPRVFWRLIRMGWGAGHCLTGANLTGANLTGADLTGANLTGADLTGANLRGAIYCQYTTWPDDYTVPADAVKVED